jgi:hypothetical protein
MGVHEVAQILQINPRSVMSIRDANPEKITLIKQSVSRKFLDVAQLSAEVARNRLLDAPETISFKDLMIGGAVATDKHLVLSGEATQRIEHVVRSGDDDFARMIEEAKRRGRQVIDAEYTEVGNMDIEAQPAQPKGPLPAALALGSGSVEPGADEVPVTCLPDMQSGGTPHNAQQLHGNRDDDTASVSGDGGHGGAGGGSGDGAGA